MHVTVVSDLHLDARTGGMARHDDIESALFRAVASANQRSQLFVCTGDLMDPDSGSCVFRCIRTCVEAIRNLRIPSIWIPGNHDVIEDGSGETTLEPLKRLEFQERVYVMDEAGYYNVTVLNQELHVLALPFTPFSHKYDPKKVIVEASSDWHPRLSLSHLNVKGAQPGDEEDMVRGREVWLPTKDVLQKFPQAVMVNGHIHRRQITEDGVHIPGSLERLRFDEERHNPGWLELELGG